MDKGINRAFLDLLFNCLLGFVFLFVVSFTLIEIDKKKADIRTKAEFVITVTWELNNQDDVDTWLRDPVGNLIWFRTKEKGLMHLDRDDLGSANDTYHLPDGTTVEYPYNQEITTIRGIIIGTWVLNVHMYKKRQPNPTNTRIEMVKLNPSHQVVFVKDLMLERDGEEITVSRFEMDSNGRIISMDDLKTPLVKDYLEQQTSIGGRE